MRTLDLQRFENEHIRLAWQYALDVVNDHVDVCQLIKLNCEHHLDLLDDQNSQYYFCETSARRVINFIQLFQHVKIYSGYIKLEPCQLYYVAMIYGTKRKIDKLRRYQKTILAVARKNGKSLLQSALCWYHLTCDDENGEPIIGPEVYLCASSYSQAQELRSVARKMAAKNSDFLERFDIQLEIETSYCHANDGIFKSIVSKVREGQSPSYVSADEAHSWRSDAIYRSLQTGMAARRQPLFSIISSAGDDTGSWFYQEWQDAVEVLKGKVENDRLFAMIYTLDDDDDWKAPEIYKKTNPNYGVSVLPTYLEDQRLKALSAQSEVHSYKTRHLSVWSGARSAFFDMSAYEQCVDASLQLQNMKGRRVYLGLDLASNSDLTCVSLLFPDVDNNEITMFAKSWLPESLANVKSTTNNYHTWSKQGHIDATPGTATDYTHILKTIRRINQDFDVIAVAYDRHLSAGLHDFLTMDGITCISVPMTVNHMSEPMKNIDLMMRQNRLKIEDNPVLKWCFSNIISKNVNGTVFPKKSTASSKIDSAVAAIIAHNRCMLEFAPDVKGSNIDGWLDALDCNFNDDDSDFQC